jgi:hypothetical protein
MPVKFLSEVIPERVAELDEHSEVVEGPDWPATLIGSSKIKDKAASRTKHRECGSAEVKQPGYVLGLVFISVRLLAEKRERWTGED